MEHIDQTLKVIAGYGFSEVEVPFRRGMQVEPKERDMVSKRKQTKRIFSKLNF